MASPIGSRREAYTWRREGVECVCLLGPEEGIRLLARYVPGAEFGSFRLRAAKSYGPSGHSRSGSNLVSFRQDDRLAK